MFLTLLNDLNVTSVGSFDLDCPPSQDTSQRKNDTTHIYILYNVYMNMSIYIYKRNIQYRYYVHTTYHFEPKKATLLASTKKMVSIYTSVSIQKKHHPQYLPATKARDSTGWQNQSKYHCDEITWLGQLLATSFGRWEEVCDLHPPFFLEKH